MICSWIWYSNWLVHAFSHGMCFFNIVVVSCGEFFIVFVCWFVGTLARQSDVEEEPRTPRTSCSLPKAPSATREWRAPWLTYLGEFHWDDSLVTYIWPLCAYDYMLCIVMCLYSHLASHLNLNRTTFYFSRKVRPPGFLGRNGNVSQTCFLEKFVNQFFDDVDPLRFARWTPLLACHYWHHTDTWNKHIFYMIERFL